MPPRGPGMGGASGFFGGPSGTSGGSYYRMIPPSYMGAYRRSRRDGLLDQSAVDRIAERAARKRNVKAKMRVRHGGLKGSIIAFRSLTIGGLRQENMFAKLDQARKDLEKGKITNNVFLKRSINAHKTYASYLYNIGYFDEIEYKTYMTKACGELGVTYEYAPEGRSR